MGIGLRGGFLRWICERRPFSARSLSFARVTVMNERLAVTPHVVEAVVNHISGPAKRGVAGIYNRALYLKERRDALSRWAVYVTCSVEKTNYPVAVGS